MGKITRLTLPCFLWVLRVYQCVISPLIGHCCRFHPSCSTYAIQALETHGFASGIYFTLKRLIRCHPWCQGGLDPIPEKPKNVNHYA